MFECRKCGRRNEAHYRFCLGCGASLAEQKELEVTRASNPIVRPADLRRCLHCKTIAGPDDVYCGGCGKPLDQTTDKEVKGPFLVAIAPDGSEGERHPIGTGNNQFGRADPPFQGDPYVSPDHLTLYWDGKVLELVDTRGANGVFVRIRKRTQLWHGARIRVGLELLVYEDLTKVEPVVSPEDGTTVLGASVGSCWGRLGRIAAPEMASHVWMLSADRVTIGREQGDITFMGDGFVSGQHAQVLREGEDVFLEDVGSSNGTFIEVEAPRGLMDGDLLLVGQQMVKISLTE